MEKKAKEILEQHGCKLVSMISECRILWQNKNGIIRTDDVAVLSNMTDEAWKFWEVN